MKYYKNLSTGEIRTSDTVNGCMLSSLQWEDITLDQWLNHSPFPIIAKVIKNINEIEHLVISGHIYDDDCHVVMPLHLLISLLK